MSNQYYLMAQLPSFSIDNEKADLPVTEEYFLDLCSRFLDDKSLKLIRELSLEPPRQGVSTGSAFLDSWYNNERDLRFALAQIRALRLNKKFDLENRTFSPEIVQAARTACGMESPLAAERYLNKYRAELIENIKPSDEFSIDSVFSYALKLKLALRIKKFDAEKGMACYHKIYDSILNADSSADKTTGVN
ncbi:MAG: DUF2764 family protein [Treponema sp.]|nr:DUF2764 family protein [Treponema sp.]MBR4449779.1 DUF2764 family protein [Treponema sp.]